MTKITVYQKNRPASWLKEHPKDTWQCDIDANDGSDHHGKGKTEAEAIMNAALAYRRWEADNNEDTNQKGILSLSETEKGALSQHDPSRSIE